MAKVLKFSEEARGKIKVGVDITDRRGQGRPWAPGAGT